MRISVLGMGYVGAVSAACLARDGHNVIGVDLDLDKLRLIEEGRAPIVEDGIQVLMRESSSSGRLTVIGMRRVRFGIRMFLSCALELHRESTASKIRRLSCASRTDRSGAARPRSFSRRGRALHGASRHRRRQLREILERTSGRRCDVDFALCFQPEFLREGSSIRDYDNPPFTVIGTRSERAGQNAAGDVRAPAVRVHRD